MEERWTEVNNHSLDKETIDGVILSIQIKNEIDFLHNAMIVDDINNRKFQDFFIPDFAC